MMAKLSPPCTPSFVISSTYPCCRPPHFSHKRPHDPAIPLVYPSAHPPKTVAVSLPSSSAPGLADPVLFLPRPAESSSSSDPPPLSSPQKYTHTFSRWPVIAPQHAPPSCSTPARLNKFGNALLPPSWPIPPPRAAPQGLPWHCHHRRLHFGLKPAGSSLEARSSRAHLLTLGAP